MKIEALSKKDLIWVIRHMSGIQGGERALRLALADLEYKQRDEMIEEADHQLSIMLAANQEYMEILANFSKIEDVSERSAVLAKAEEAMVRASAAEALYKKLTEDIDGKMA